MWSEMKRLCVLPPPWRLDNPGRPSNYARRKRINETTSSANKTKLTQEKRVMSCSKCKEEGHNKTTYSKPSVETQPKRPRGRPRKDHVCFNVLVIKEEIMLLYLHLMMLPICLNVHIFLNVHTFYCQF